MNNNTDQQIEILSLVIERLINILAGQEPLLDAGTDTGLNRYAQYQKTAFILVISHLLVLRSQIRKESES